MKFSRFFTVFLLLCSLCFDAFAFELIEKFHDWSLFKANRGDQPICYLAAMPIKKEGNYIKRGDPYFIINHMLGDADEISISSGFIYNKMSNVELSFSKAKFYLFPHVSVAWANDRNEDLEVIKAMQKHDQFVVSGIATNNNIANDTYSLIGFTQAYDKMRKTCKQHLK